MISTLARSSSRTSNNNSRPDTVVDCGAVAVRSFTSICPAQDEGQIQ